jgi:hypothetical protein
MRGHVRLLTMIRKAHMKSTAWDAEQKGELAADALPTLKQSSTRDLLRQAAGSSLPMPWIHRPQQD